MDASYTQTTKQKSKKEVITLTVLNEMPKTLHECELDLETVIGRWWMSGRQHGLRLSDHGHTAFKLANITSYDFEFDVPKPNEYLGLLLNLGKKINCPYYLITSPNTRKKLILRTYDSRIAMMLNLYGDLTSYLNSIK